MANRHEIRGVDRMTDEQIDEQKQNALADYPNAVFLPQEVADDGYTEIIPFDVPTEDGEL